MRSLITCMLLVCLQNNYFLSQKDVSMLAINCDRKMATKFSTLSKTLSFFFLQVVAREMLLAGSSSAASAPITLTVKLLDTNDNAPRFSVYPPVVVPAGEQHITLKKVILFHTSSFSHKKVILFHTSFFHTKR